MNDERFDAYDREVRAERARQILGDPLFVECVTSIEADLVEEIVAAEIGNAAAVQILAVRLQALRSIVRQLGSYMEAGQNPQPEAGKAFV